MARMKAVMAAALVMEREGISQAFGVPGAAITSAAAITAFMRAIFVSPATCRVAEANGLLHRGRGQRR